MHLPLNFCFWFQTFESLQLIVSQNFSDLSTTDLSLSSLLGEKSSSSSRDTSVFTSLRTLLLSAEVSGEGEDAQMKDESINQNEDEKTKTKSVAQLSEKVSSALNKAMTQIIAAYK